jgi:hypothetical protein
MTDVLLRNILGTAFDRMPEAVRRMHSIARTQDARGISRVMAGRNPVSRLIRVIALLPRPAHRASIHIRFIKGHNLEEWDRYFGRSRFHTVMKQEGPYLSEQLVGFPVTFVYEVRASERGFSLHVAQVRFLGVGLPRLLRPTLRARASEWRGRYRFSTLVGFWFCGRVISYFGYLEGAACSSHPRNPSKDGKQLKRPASMHSTPRASWSLRVAGFCRRARRS